MRCVVFCYGVLDRVVLSCSICVVVRCVVVSRCVMLYYIVRCTLLCFVVLCLVCCVALS